MVLMPIKPLSVRVCTFCTQSPLPSQIARIIGHIPGRTYMPSKPRKYGVKIFWACESTTGYALNGLIYTGKPIDGPPHKNLAFVVVFELVKPFANTGREIVTDRFFTSHMLAVRLLELNLTLLGTVKSGRKEVPNCLRDVKTREVHSVVSLYDHDNRLVLCSYVPKKNRNVLLLSSSSHCETQISDDNGKPIQILDYNAHKGSVDVMDGVIEEFTVRRKTVRWPMLIAYNIMMFHGTMLSFS